MCTPKPQIAKEEDNKHRKWRWRRKYPTNSPEESSKQQNFFKLHPAPLLVPIPPSQASNPPKNIFPLWATPKKKKSPCLLSFLLAKTPSPKLTSPASHYPLPCASLSKCHLHPPPWASYWRPPHIHSWSLPGDVPHPHWKCSWLLNESKQNNYNNNKN